MSELREVVVTGLGAITPSGTTPGALWDAVRSGRSAITRLDDDPEFADLAVRIGGRVTGFDAEAVLTRQQARRVDAVVAWAVAAGDQALAQALSRALGPGDRLSSKASDGAAEAPSGYAPLGPKPALDLPWDPPRIQVTVGTGSGPVRAMQQATRLLDAEGPRRVPLSLAMHGAPDSAAAVISQRHGIQGPADSVSATCASGTVALGRALRTIRHGYADAVLVVGMEDCLGPVNLSSNANLRALASGCEDDPAAASRPFAANRRGFVMSQGAAAILVESASSAASRGARALARITGFGDSSDAFHPTAPHPDGRGAAQAMHRALADAGLAPAAIGHINAHGTSTAAGDSAELAAVTTVFGTDAPPISATKSSTGHLLGAGGVVEAIIAIATLEDQLLPPTINLAQPDPAFADFDLVTAARRVEHLDHVLSNSFGFGGHNASLVVSRMQPE